MFYLNDNVIESLNKRSQLSKIDVPISNKSNDELSVNCIADMMFAGDVRRIRLPCRLLFGDFNGKCR
jgi:hypothetical protein